MKIEEKQLDKIIVKLARLGVGSKKQLSDFIGCSQSAISRLINDGKIHKKYEGKLNQWIKTK